MVTIALRTKDTQPNQTCSEGYTFSATALYRGVSLFLGSINSTRLAWACSEERRLLVPKLAFWSELPSACAAKPYSFCASVTTVYLFFVVIGYWESIN